MGDEMGLGKTMQVITLLLSEKMGKRSPSLIIAPATLIENWRRELSAFGPGLTVLVHVGQGRAGIHSELSGFDIVITSYDTAVRDETILSSILWDILVIDEAQNIKTPRAQRTLSIKSLPRRVSVAVTGTPVENSLTDLWSLSDFVLPGLLGDVNSFKSVFSDSLSDASALSGIVAPLLLRRRIREVARDLPPKIDIPQVVVMTESMAEGYERIRSDVLQEYGSSATLVSLQKLRMFCAHPILADFPCHDPAADMPKYIRLLEILEEIFAVGEKCLVFTGYTGMIDLLVRDLKVRFEDSFVDFVDGRVPVAERLPVVDRFSSFNGSGALILNP
ncbi:MAG: SNF2-related protein, partial [Rectinemataceae bacterium]|nr:SNF2-related protein [Rectinemataceae bacterium]